ncbi:hypothetical protein [Bdellovibrio sp. BCCA]|uniref:hypothetical protein n=1 Tax=Bdellovibrio sp. BCCA TaxID=3136281 RepID=UPI0030F299E1
MIYVLFVMVMFDEIHSGGLGTFQYEFSDKTQCENSLTVMKRRFENSLKATDVKVIGYCQEVRKTKTTQKP